MPYTPYYPAGWDDSPATTTPITAAALDAMDAGIGAAQSAADTEAGRAQAAESLLAPSSALAAETARAQAAEAANAAAVAAEAARAQAAETALGEETGGGGVTSVNTQTGDVTLSAADVGADAAGTAASVVATETGRAETAEALLAPKASPALTGTPTAPTASPLTNSAQIASTAYADAAAGAEKTRALAAEALLASSSALTAETTRAGAAEAANATAISAEATRAEAAEALLATSAALTAETSRAETAEAGKLATANSLSELSATASAARANLGLGSAATQSTSAFDAAGSAAAAQSAAEAAIPSSLPPSGTAGGVLAGSYPNPSGLAATAVTPGSYTSASVTVAADGRVTAASSGSAAGWTPILPSGRFAQTFARELASNQQTVISTVAYATAISLQAGQVVTSIAMASGSTVPSGQTHMWYLLLSSGLQVLAETADQGSGNAVAAKTLYSLALTSPYTVPSPGVYYVVLCGGWSTTPATWWSLSTSNDLTTGGSGPALTPAQAGTLGFSASIPSVGFTFGSLSASSSMMYACLG